MSLSARIIGTLIAATTVAAITGASFLVAALDGNWLAFLAGAVLLLVLSLAAFVLLGLSGSAMVAASEGAEDRTSDAYQELVEGLHRLDRDGGISNPEEYITHPYGDPNCDRDRRAS